MLIARSVECAKEGEREREREQERRRGRGNTVGFGYNWETTKRAQHAPNGRLIDGAKATFHLLPVPCDRIQARMELPAAGEHVFAVEGIEKKRIRKVAEREHVCKSAPDVKISRLT